MAHHSTKTDRSSLPVTDSIPVLKLLFSQEEGLCELQRALTEGELLIGRAVASGQGMALPWDRLASKQHARLKLEGGRARLTDLKSYNQTYVNGKAITACDLEDGDIIRIGGSLLLFRVENGIVRDAPTEAVSLHRSLLGRSPVMARLRARLAAVATRSDSVLLLGETGTGKELAARAVHEHSGLRGPLVTYNLGRLTASTAESTLFGHERGAFTGADRARIGLFEEARGGTLFLDEVGELAIDLQPMLLRVLEQRMVRSLGGSREIPINVRIIAATNLDLQQASVIGRFRSDLLARLAQVPVHLPPLRDRQEDVLPLFLHYLGSKPRLMVRLCEALLLYPWPANLRDLINLARQLQAFEGTADVLDFPAVRELLPLPPRAELPAATQPADPSLSPVIMPTQRHRVHYTPEMIERLLQEHRGIVTRVAEAAGLSRRQLTRKLKDWGLDPARFQLRKR